MYSVPEQCTSQCTASTMMTMFSWYSSYTIALYNAQVSKCTPLNCTVQQVKYCTLYRFCTLIMYSGYNTVERSTACKPAHARKGLGGEQCLPTSTALNCTALHCTTILYCTALHYYTALHCTALLYCIALHCTNILHCTALHYYTALHCNALQYMIL